MTWPPDLLDPSSQMSQLTLFQQIYQLAEFPSILAMMLSQRLRMSDVQTKKLLNELVPPEPAYLYANERRERMDTAKDRQKVSSFEARSEVGACVAVGPHNYSLTSHKRRKRQTDTKDRRTLHDFMLTKVQLYH